MTSKYPIYVISKGRWKARLTQKALEMMGADYWMVVEPTEFKNYAENIPSKNILQLPFHDLNQGSIPARNWVWDHAQEHGAERHWILDDNIAAFYRFHENKRVRVKNTVPFQAIEDFVDRYENFALAGMQYLTFAPQRVHHEPIILNTRIYSCILIDTARPYRWRGQYNEDTDLSLRILKDGLCTVLFNAFLCEKRATLTCVGGNTDTVYAGDVEAKRLKMARSLVQQHPDVTTIARRWDRWQHVVNYRPFKGNRPILKEGVVVPTGTNDYNLKLRKVKDG